MHEAVPRTKFGMQWLDKALEGGIPTGNLVVVSGGAGTGKSTLCMQYLVNGATLFGEKGLYISTEQSEPELRKAAKNFGWDLERLQKDGLLKIHYINLIKGDSILETIDYMTEKFQPKRIVIDSMTSLTDILATSELKENIAFSMVQVAETVSPVPRTEQMITKVILFSLISKLKQHNSTALLSSELPEKSDYLTSDNVSEFITDGVILLHYLEVGITDYRSMEIRKMRYTNHKKDAIPYNIAERGIELFEEKESKS